MSAPTSPSSSANPGSGELLAQPLSDRPVSAGPSHAAQPSRGTSNGSAGPSRPLPLSPTPGEDPPKPGHGVELDARTLENERKLDELAAQGAMRALPFRVDPTKHHPSPHPEGTIQERRRERRARLRDEGREIREPGEPRAPVRRVLVDLRVRDREESESESEPEPEPEPEQSPEREPERDESQSSSDGLHDGLNDGDDVSLADVPDEYLAGAGYRSLVTVAALVVILMPIVAGSLWMGFDILKRGV